LQKKLAKLIIDFTASISEKISAIFSDKIDSSNEMESL